MERILWQKVQVLKYRIISELKLIRNQTVVHPGAAYNAHWTCGLSRGLAMITAPSQYPGVDVLSRFWENLAKEVHFMNS